MHLARRDVRTGQGRAHARMVGRRFRCKMAAATQPNVLSTGSRGCCPQCALAQRHTWKSDRVQLLEHFSRVPRASSSFLPGASLQWRRRDLFGLPCMKRWPGFTALSKGGVAAAAGPSAAESASVTDCCAIRTERSHSSARTAETMQFSSDTRSKPPTTPFLCASGRVPECRVRRSMESFRKRN